MYMLGIDEIRSDGVASGAHMRDSEIFIFYGCRELNLIDKIFV